MSGSLGLFVLRLWISQAGNSRLLGCWLSGYCEFGSCGFRFLGVLYNFVLLGLGLCLHNFNAEASVSEEVVMLYEWRDLAYLQDEPTMVSMWMLLYRVEH